MSNVTHANTPHTCIKPRLCGVLVIIPGRRIIILVMPAVGIAHIKQGLNFRAADRRIGGQIKFVFLILPLKELIFVIYIFRWHT